MKLAVSVRQVSSHFDKTFCDPFDILNVVIEELACG